MTPTDQRINSFFNVFFAGLAVLLFATFVAFALLTGHVAWWLSAAASAVTAWALIRRLRSGNGRVARSDSISSG